MDLTKQDLQDLGWALCVAIGCETNPEYKVRFEQLYERLRDFRETQPMRYSFKSRLTRIYSRLMSDIEHLEHLATSCRGFEPEYGSTRYTILRLGDLAQRLERKFREA